MKTLPRLIVLLLLSAAALCTMSSVALGASRLVYSDEFNGPLSTTVWTNNTPWNTHYTTGELEYYDPANCTFASGLMTLKSEKRSTNGYSYASGIVTSLPHAKFSYGYFEIRAKLPKGPGIWPAFWLTNDHSLEIDGLEMLGDRPSRIYMTLHENDNQIYQGIKNGPDYSAGFHTYGIDWQRTYVKWYIDGVLCASYTKSIPSDPMWICLNTAVGGSWPGSPTSATKFPVDYAIDYVRVYDTKPAGSIAPAVATTALSTTIVTRPAVTAKNRGRKTYRIAGLVRVGTVVKPLPALTSVVATATPPFRFTVQVQRHVRGQWRVYKTAHMVNLAARYSTVVRLRSGTFRARALVVGGGTPAGKSSWTRAFRVR